MSDNLVNLENVSVSRKENLLLSDINLKLKPGEFVYLTGHIGSGKTSLMKTLYADLPLKNGQAELAGYDLKSLTKSDLPFFRRKLGIVFQDYKLLQDRSIEDNLRFAMEAVGQTNTRTLRQKVKETLEKINLSDKAQKMPFELSGGEQQLVVIARALINEPQIILADEPTGNLDEQTSDTVMQLLFSELIRGACMIMATHNENVMAKFPGKKISIDDKPTG